MGDQIAGWIIGTAPDCDMTVVDEYASKRHVAIVRDEDGRVWVADLGSTNGTYIRRAVGSGSVKVKVPLGSRALLRPGDALVVGRTEIPWSVKP